VTWRNCGGVSVVPGRSQQPLRPAQFDLADYAQVNGLLMTGVVREIPEAMKRRRTDINGSNVRQLEAKAG
jgi:hypothetical protein